MTSEVMEAVLTLLNQKLSNEKRKVILLLDNATCHPESFIGRFSHIKLIFLPKNTTSMLQPLDAGVIQIFKVKYRKRLIKCVLARVNEKKFASEVVKSLNVLQAIQWVQESWKDVTNDDLEFAALVREFTPDTSASEYVNFDADLQASEPMINNQEIGW